MKYTKNMNDISHINEYLPVMHLSEIKGKNRKEGEDWECPICLQKMEEKEQIRTTLCQQIVHRQCLDECLSKAMKCPFCRGEMTENGLKERMTLNNRLSIKKIE